MTAFTSTIEQIFETPATAQNTVQENQITESVMQENTETPDSVQENKKKTDEEKKANNSLFLEEKRAQGYQLTHINENETNFFQYADALSDELKNTLLSSFDCEQDYVLQKQIAELFKSGNVWQTNTLIHQLYSMGYTVNVETIATQYITDWKNGRSSYLRTDGAINVLTISDGKGGEIKIADSNGNGAIELEEIYLNEILEGIASDEFLVGDIGEVIGGKSGGHSFFSGGIKGLAGSLFNFIKDGVDDLKEKRNKKIAQREYNKLIDDYIAQNHCLYVSEAIAQINRKYGCNTNEVQYTGKFKGQVYTSTIDAMAGMAEDEAQSETTENA